MSAQTQQWPVQPLGQASWLGFFLACFLVGFLSMWGLAWLQATEAKAAHALLGLVVLCLGLWWLLLCSRQARRRQYHTLHYQPQLGWSFSGSKQHYKLRHLWHSPFFCTLWLEEYTQTPQSRTHSFLSQFSMFIGRESRHKVVVCWRYRLSNAQWRQLLQSLRVVQLGGATRNQ